MRRKLTEIETMQRNYIKERLPLRRFNRSKRKCFREERAWKITFQEYERIIDNPCHYCGQKHDECGTGLDRIDSSIGYTLDNVVSCCGVCNMMKQSFDFEVFINYIQKIYNNVFGNRSKA